MTTPTNHWKLGLFVVAAVLIGLGAVVYFGSRSLPKDAVTYVSYFDEAVTGLERGSPVKYRGVTVGNVSQIEVAPDRRHVAVSYDIEAAVAQKLALEGSANEKASLKSNLRAQLGSQGVTGVKYVSLDLFDGEAAPEPMPFKVPDRYIPTTPSTLRSLEIAVNKASNNLPEVTQEIMTMLTRINGLLQQIEGERIPQRAGATLTRVDRVLAVAETRLTQFKAAELSDEARATLAQFQLTADRVNRLLDRVDGNQGLIANAERASLSMGDAARNASQIGSEAERTLREIGEAAAAVRELADALERQPDMLLKGRARSGP